MSRPITLTIACMLLLQINNAQAQEAHPSFPENDNMNAYLDQRALHRDKLDSTAREWQEDWYGYAEQRYGTNPIFTTETEEKPEAPQSPESTESVESDTIQ